MNFKRISECVGWKSISACLVGFMLTGCAAYQLPAPAGNVESETKGNSTKSALLWLNTSIEYRWNTQLVYQSAANRIYSYVGSDTVEKWGVFLDLDETVLDNSTFQQRLIAQNASFNKQLWTEWLMQEQAVLVPGALSFLEEVKRLGGLVVFVSNRPVSSEEATRNNLAALGVPYDELLLNSGMKGKAERWRSAIEEFGFQPVLWLGDQISDFPLFEEGYAADDCPAFTSANSYSKPEEDVASEQLGRCIFVIANPIYGQWK